MNSQKKPTIYYAYDALCGWCYGFSPVMKKLYDNYKSEIDFIAISGGMILGNREGKIGKVASYIEKAHKVVEEHSGVQFGEGFLELLRKGEAYFSSLPPALALAVFKDYYPLRSIEFAHALQKAIYYDGIEINKPEMYAPYFAEFGILKEDYMDKIGQQKYFQEAQADFEQVFEWGVTGFPTLFIQTSENEVQYLSQGFNQYENVVQRLDQIMK